MTRLIDACRCARFLPLAGLGLVLSFMPLSRLSAQAPQLSPRGEAMAGAAFDGFACGAEALAANPAVLARGCDAAIRAIMPPTLAVEMLANGAGGVLWRNRAALLDALDEESLSEHVSPAVRAEILASIPPEGVRHRQRLALPLVQIPFGRTALGLSWTAEAEGRVDRDLAELLFEGYEKGRVDYSVGRTGESATGYWTLAAGHGRSLYGFDVGATARLISGTFLTRWQAFDPVISVEDRTGSGQLIGAFAGDNITGGSLFEFRAPDGFGWGVDFGVMRQVGPVRIGAGIQNFLGGMSWNDETHLHIVSFEATVDSAGFSTEERVHDPAASSPEADRVIGDLRDDAEFPRRFRLSAAWETALVSVGAGAMVAQGDGRLDPDWDRRLSVGAEVRPLLPIRLRAGMSGDLDGRAELGGGLGVRLGGFMLEASGTRVWDEGPLGGWRVVAGVSIW